MSKSKMCKTCIHTNVCRRDKNIVGDIFVPGNPLFFDNDELFKKYKEREAAGFPCNEYMSTADIEPIIHCKYCQYYEFTDNRVPEEQCWWCYRWHEERKETDYCSEGKRREEQ